MSQHIQTYNTRSKTSPTCFQAMLSLRIELVCLFLLMTGCSGGCNGTPASNTSGINSSSNSNSSQLVLDGVVSTLNHLPDSIVLELSPPVLKLGARQTSNHREILATLGLSPDVAAPEENANYNVLTVRSKNINFKQEGIRSGDVARFFAKQDSELGEQMGIASFGYFEMPILQVLSETSLLVSAGLNQPVEQPTKLQIWRNTDARSEEIQNAQQLYVQRGYPPFGWEPSPDSVALEQLVQRLNQWIQDAPNTTDWSLPKLYSTLPDKLRKSKRLAPLFSQKALAELSFQPHEGRWLQQAIWMRDIAAWARGDAVSQLDQAAALFDWTVRNIELIAESNLQPPREPWEVLLYGKGTASQRGEVFALLCKQLGIDVIIIEPETNDASKPPVLCAAFIDGALYLFSPTLGLPIPGADNQGIATLKMAQSDDAIFRQLDIGEQKKFAWSMDTAKQAAIKIIASPLSLSRRADLLESQLAGSDAVLLVTRVDLLAKKVREETGIENIALWPQPFETLWAKRMLVPAKDKTLPGEKRKTFLRRRIARDFLPFALEPRLWKARVLHFQGINRTTILAAHGGLEETFNAHQVAQKYYRSVRPSPQKLARSKSKEELFVRTQAKQHASLWLPQLLYDDGEFKIAADWFKRFVEEKPERPSHAFALYNLARCYEALNQNAKAITLYKQDKSLQHHGNFIRARRLEGDSGEE